MPTYGKIRVAGVLFQSEPGAAAEDGELYIDSSSSQLSQKGAGSSTTPIGSVPSSSNPLQKQMQNLSGVTIPINATVAKLVNGGIAAADSDAAGKTKVIGIARESIANNIVGTVGLLGPNWDGAVAGLGFSPGDLIYMAESSGAYTNNISSFTGGDDRLVRVGIADCASGTASPVATDLLCILTEEVASNV